MGEDDYEITAASECRPGRIQRGGRGPSGAGTAPGGIGACGAGRGGGGPGRRGSRQRRAVRRAVPARFPRVIAARRDPVDRGGADGGSSRGAVGAPEAAVAAEAERGPGQETGADPPRLRERRPAAAAASGPELPMEARPARPGQAPSSPSQEEGGVSDHPTGSHAARLLFRAVRPTSSPASCSGRWSSPRSAGAGPAAGSSRPRPTSAGTTRPRTATATGGTRRTNRSTARRAAGTSTCRTACTGAPTWCAARGARQRRAAPGAGAGRGARDHAPPAGRGRRPPAVLRTRASSVRRSASRASLDGQMMRRSAVTVRPRSAVRDRRLTPRIGITKAADWPLRFVVAARPGLRARHGE